MLHKQFSDITSGELGPDFLHSRRFSAQTRSQQHRNLRSVQVRGGAAGRGMTPRDHSAAEITCIYLQHKLSWHLQCLLCVWHLCFILRYLFVFFSLFVSVTVNPPEDLLLCSHIAYYGLSADTLRGGWLGKVHRKSGGSPLDNVRRISRLQSMSESSFRLVKTVELVTWMPIWMLKQAFSL